MGELSAVGKSKGMEGGDSNVAAVFLHPNVGSDLASHLLVNCPRILSLSQLVRQRAAENEPRGCAAAHHDYDQDTHVETTLSPIFGWDHFEYVVVVVVAQVQVASHHGGDGFPFVP